VIQITYNHERSQFQSVFGRFDRDSYEWVLPENSPDFPVPFFVSAQDSDENGTNNAEVSPESFIILNEEVLHWNSICR
jgi:hypothetical protein